MNEVFGSLDGLVAAPSGTAASVLTSPPGFLELLPIAVCACNAAGRILWFNRRAAKLWGRSPGIGDDAGPLCGSDELYQAEGEALHRNETPVTRVLRTGTPIHDREATIEQPEGTRIIVMMHIDPVLGFEGRPIGTINCFQDITAIKRAEQRARESERQARDILEALPAAVYTTDAAGRVTYYNQAAADLAGRKPVLGVDQWCVTWRMYRPDGTPVERGACPMAVALQENRTVRGVEAVAERPDGTRVPLLPYPTPLHDDAGRLIGAVNMLVDISDRKDAETRQKMLVAELNHRVKNNMQILHSLLRAAQRDTRDSDARAALANAIQRVAAMAAAQKVLYQTTNATEFSTRDFLDSVCFSARQSLGHGIRVEWKSVDGELSNDTAMPLALILNELLVNAAKHGICGSGEGSIRIAIEKESDTFTLSVEDDGPGFDLAEVRRRSSGLGLVAGLAGQLGGMLEVERAPGARCVVRFPVARRQDTRAFSGE